MILSTPKTISSPAATTNRIAAVVTTSSSRTTKLLQLGALIAGIDVGEGLDHLHAAVRLDLAEIHGQRSVVLVSHIDRSAGPIEGNLRQSGQHLCLVEAAGLLNRGL